MEPNTVNKMDAASHFYSEEWSVIILKALSLCTGAGFQSEEEEEEEQKESLQKHTGESFHTL